MRLQTLARFTLAAAVALLLCGPAALAGDDNAADSGSATVGPSVEQDRADDDRASSAGTGLTERDDVADPPSASLPDSGGMRHERVDRRAGARPERPDRSDRVGSDVPRPDVRPDRSERPGTSGVRPN